MCAIKYAVYCFLMKSIQPNAYVQLTECKQLQTYKGRIALCTTKVDETSYNSCL